MTTKRILVGMLGCLGVASGLSAACPPEGEDCNVHVVRMQGQQPGESGMHPIVAHLVRSLAEAEGTDPAVVNEHLQHLHLMLQRLGDDVQLEALPAQLHTLASQVHADVLPALAHLQALGQPEAKAKAKTRVVAGNKAKGDDSGPGNFVIVQDDNAVAVKLEDGKIVSINYNGKKVPLDKIEREGDHVKILGDGDKPVFEFDLNDSGPAVSAGKGGQWAFSRGDASGGPTKVFVEAEPPKAMVGVQLGEPDGMILGHFGLKPGEATLVTGVYEDLPGGAAGLKPYDIIVAVDGNKPAGQGDVREALRSKDEGDSVTLTVIHRGERKDVKVKLVKYDQEALEKSKLDAVEANAMAFAVGKGGPGDVIVAPGIGQLRNLQGQDAEKWREFAEVWRKQAEDFGEKFKDDPNFQQAFKLHLDRVPDAPPAPPAAGGDSRWERLEERLERLEKMIERMAERQSESGHSAPKK